MKRKLKLRRVMKPDDKEQDVKPGDLPSPGTKFLKEIVNYRYAPNPDRACGTCVYYREPGACEIVAGLIRRIDVCDKFKAEEPGITRATLVGLGESSEVTPPGYENIVRGLKKSDVDNPWAVAWSMKNKGIMPKTAVRASLVTSEGGPGSGRHPEGAGEQPDAVATARQHGWKASHHQKPPGGGSGYTVFKHENHPGHELHISDKPSADFSHRIKPIPGNVAGDSVGQPGRGSKELSAHLNWFHGKTSEGGPGSGPRPDGRAPIRKDSGGVAERRAQYTVGPQMRRHEMKKTARGMNAEGGPGSGRRPGFGRAPVDLHPADKKYMDHWGGTIKDMISRGHTPALPSGMKFTSAHAQYAKGLASEGGPGSGPSKFAPEQPQSDEDRMTSKFTRHETPAQRSARIRNMKVDPDRAKVFKKLCVQATLAEDVGLPPMSDMSQKRTTHGIPGIGHGA